MSITQIPKPDPKIAFAGVIIIWTTTPLAIKWSGEGVGFLFGVTGRMVIGALLALVSLALMRVELPWHRDARRVYLAAGLGIFGTMSCVYWSAQFIPSGWISVIFGLTPMATGVMAFYLLGEASLSRHRLLGMLLGAAGLAVIFGRGVGLGEGAVEGVLVVLLAMMLHSASTVWVKSLNQGLPGMSVATGGLLVAVPLFLATWFLTGSTWPREISVRAMGSILYLAFFGSVIGFALYFFVLRHVEATRTALITLITPVTALLLGHWLNDEPLGWRIWFGTALILAGLMSFEGGTLLLRRLLVSRRRAGP